MMKTTLQASVLVTSIAIILSGCATSAGQQANSSTVPAAKQSMTDSQIHADYAGYQAQQGQIKALNDSGKFPVASYSLAKAQCWLDVSLHEYTRNDRSNFPVQAFAESAKITDYLKQNGNEAGASNPANATPLVNDAAKVRPDLWAALQALKVSEGFKCAAQKTACAEVELVHAGNEQNQQQWRHSKPYVQIAEDLTADAQKAAAACVPPPAPKVVEAPAAVVAKPAPAPVAPPPPVAVNLSANVLFNFDKRDLKNVRPNTKEQLDGAIAQLKSGVTVTGIKLIGHADRLNSTGNANYNVQLSQDRVAAIREYLIANGIAASLISTDFKADSQQVESCTPAKFANKAALQECLLPNRRVEVQFSGTKKAG
jgi:OmpA-OmpF porin, OOP family